MVPERNDDSGLVAVVHAALRHHDLVTIADADAGGAGRAFSIQPLLT